MSALLCRTLLKCKTMFRNGFQSIDNATAMQLSFDALSDLIAMDDLLNAFTAAESREIDKAQKMERKDASQTVPGLVNVLSANRSLRKRITLQCH